MNSKKNSLLVLLIIISLSLICKANTQKGTKLLRAYLIINNTSNTLKNDSLFKANLISAVKTELRKKNYLLVPNSEMEEAGKPNLYIYVNISNKLKINAVKVGVNDFVVRVPLPDKTWVFANNDELIRQVIYYIKKYI